MPVTEYTWDPATDSILEETDGAGNVLTSYTNEPSAYGPLVSQQRDGDSRYFHFDALGSTRELTGSDGSVTDTLEYDAWGNEVTRNGSSLTPYQWIGRFGYATCEEYRTLEARRRGYSSHLGLWASKDPLYSRATKSIAPYAYADNTPLTSIDPLGLFTVRDREPKAFSAPPPSKACFGLIKLGEPKSVFNKEPNEFDDLKIAYGVSDYSVTLGFIQLVHVEIVVTAGSVVGGKPGCPLPPKCECVNHSYSFTYTFLETRGETDNHPITVRQEPFERLNSLCGGLFSCCPKSYSMITTKELVIGPRARHSNSCATDLTGPNPASYKCANGPQLPDPSPPRPLTMPERQCPANNGLVFPNPVLSDHMVSVLELKAEHGLCSPWVARAEWTNYNPA